MGNRKENLKKSLGLTEYPWSSDDESNPMVSTMSRNPRTENDGPNMPGTSGQQTSLSPSRRRSEPTRLERDIFWSLLNSDTVPTPGSFSFRAGPSASQPEDTRERIDLDSPVANIQRLLAINRLPKCINTGRSNRKRGVSPLLGDLSATIKLGRIKRRPPCRQAMASCSRNSIIPAVMDNTASPEAQASSSRGGVARHNLHISLSVDDHTPMRSMSPRASSNNNGAEENMKVESPTSRDSQEEIVEINAEEGGSGPDQTAVSPQAAAQRTEVAGVAGASTSSQTSKRRTESRDDEVVSVHDFNQGLLRLLECPVCLEWMEPPLAQCRRGHLICSRCRKRLGACPVCRTAFSSVRNRAMEAVTELLRYPCRHGCGRDTRLRARAAHEASCDARLYRCPAPACAARAPLPLAELQHHCQAEHPSMVRVGRRHRFSMRTGQESHNSWLLATAGALFQLRVDTDVRAWGVYVYVVYFGPQCKAHKYTYEVTVNGHHNKRRLVYARATHSDLECNSLNVRRQDCFHLTAEQTPNFLTVRSRHNKPEQFLDFVVEVTEHEADAPGAPRDLDS